MRIGFLNWRPDRDDFGNDGLTEAKNVVHDTEGYKPVYLMSSGAFNTTGGLQSVVSVQARPFGPSTDYLVAWIADNTLNIGVNGNTMTSVTTGFPLSWATTGTNQVIAFFDVCELDSKVFFVVEAWQDQSSPLTAVPLRHCGYFSY